MIPNRYSQQLLRQWGLLILLGTVTAVLYVPSVRTWYFSDCFNFFFANPREHILSGFTGDFYGLWRPLEVTAHACQQLIFGWGTWPLHLLQVAMHCAMIIVVYALCRQIGGTLIHAFIAATYCAVAQVNVQALVRVDTLGQVGAGLFMALTALAMSQSTRRFTRLPNILDKWYLLALTCFVVSMLWKEHGCSTLLIVSLIVGATALRASNQKLLRKKVIKGLWTVLPFAVVFVVYYSYRTSVIDLSKLNKYLEVSLGFGVLKHIFLLIGAAVTPVSAHKILLWHESRNLPMLALVGLGTLLVCIMVAAGLRKFPKATSSCLILAAVLLTMPSALITRVSEIYSYNVIPAVSLLFGLGIGNLLVATYRSKSRLQCLLVLGMLAIIVVTNVSSVVEKRDLIVHNGDIARKLFPQLISIVQQAKPNSNLMILDQENTFEYSMILVHKAKTVVEIGYQRDQRLKEFTGRMDVNIKVISSVTKIDQPNQLIYMIYDGKLVRYTPDNSLLLKS